jgi:tetratricopeptide (TPR) repeat protein
LIVLILSLVLTVSVALMAQSAQDLYQRGLVQEHAAGNLKQAIELYAQAAKMAGKDRALAARALIRMGSSQEKLGAAPDAEKTYGELLRTFPEQRAEVAIAKERLKALRRAAKIVSSDRTVRVDRAPDAELAVRLAAFLWHDLPDGQLAEVARRGQLGEPGELKRQVVRMLRDQRVDGLLDNFFVKWLALDKLKTSRPDPVVFPQVDRELLEAMGTETRLFVQSQLREDRDAVELWTAPYTFVNERLARHYGLQSVSGRDFRRVARQDPNRRGLLGQASLLTALSTASRTSPTSRGMYVSNRFFGIDVPPPPTNIPPLPERPREASGTMRGRMTAHRTNPSCASCHAMFDPLGFALENFDAVGRWRTTDGGLPIDASGTFSDGTRFTGPIELREGLLKRRALYYANVTKQLLAHALNRTTPGRVYDYEMPGVRQIVRDAAIDGYRWSALIAGIAASAPFQAKEIVP